MIVKYHKWKSYIFLLISLLVTASLFLLDPISRATSEMAAPMMIAFIGVGTIISFSMAIINFSTLTEKKVVPAIALTVTIFNTLFIILFLIIGFNIA
ncbi:hypothetical protein J6TS2_08170 [Heyndrickxia sporothermodurans]|nr:hypothetical protein J6TS2_08170 [Heyndrickxia sporothermodurans]